MNVLIAGSEAVPFVKVGGLGDVLGALTEVLGEKNIECETIIPFYRKIIKASNIMEKSEIQFIHNDQIIKCKIYETDFPGKKNKCLLVDYPYYFDRDNVYGYEDEIERFVLFSKAVYSYIETGEREISIIHLNDWQTALIAPYLKIYSRKKIPVLFTIHNMKFQGIFDSNSYRILSLPGELLYPAAPMEYYNNVNLMKGGLVFSDAISTVSETYAREIKTSAFGEGLDGVLNSKGTVYGILNGISYQEWNPETDKSIQFTYDLKTADKKEMNKIALLNEFKIPYKKNIPLIGIVSRLDSQKGFDIILENFDSLMELPFHFIVLGTGERKYEEALTHYSNIYSDRFKCRIAFDSDLSHKIIAGSDFFLMPSKYEPCGLTQMYSLRYGTIPIVRATGGLADTIIDVNENSISGNGFSFYDYNSKELIKTIERAIEYYKRKKHMQNLIIRAMTSDVSWESSVDKYLNLYRILQNK